MALRLSHLLAGLPLLAALGILPLSAQTPPPPPIPGWPRQFYYSGDSITIYQPQVDSWQDNLIRAHAAVAIKAPGMDAPTYGVISMQGVTAVNKDTRLVDLYDIAVTNAEVPGGRQPGVEFRGDADAGGPGRGKRRVARPARTQPVGQRGAAGGQRRPGPEHPAQHHLHAHRQSLLVTVDGAPKLRRGHRAAGDAGREYVGVPGAGRIGPLLAARVRRVHDGHGARRGRGPWRTRCRPPSRRRRRRPPSPARWT